MQQADTPVNSASPGKGVLYIVIRKKEILDEALHSATTLKKHNPGLCTQLITDITLAKKPKCFDFVDTMPPGMNPWKAKVKYFALTRFEKTLYLDADTEVRASIGELFDVLDTADIGVTFDNRCDWTVSPPRYLAQESEDVNTGFLLFKDTAAVRTLLTEWFDRIFTQDESVMTPGTLCDQHYFNTYLRDRVLSGREVAPKVLPNTVYNVRPWCWDHLRANRLFDGAKILHAHHLHHGFLEKIKRNFSRRIS